MKGRHKHSLITNARDEKEVCIIHNQIQFLMSIHFVCMQLAECKTFKIISVNRMNIILIIIFKSYHTSCNRILNFCKLAIHSII